MTATLETGITPAGRSDLIASGFIAEMQTTLAPPLSYRGRQVEAHGVSIPKDGVGGDLMDLVEGDGEVIAYVGDVSGHGLRAGVLMGMIKTAMRYGLLLRRPLRKLMTDLNRLLPQVKAPSMYATLAALRFDGGNEAEFISAGHVPLLHFRNKTGEVTRHYAHERPLGLLAGEGQASERFSIAAGDIFLLVSDGAVELGEERDAEFGFELLANTLRNTHERPLPEVLRAIEEDMGRHGAADDDRTILLVRVSGECGERVQVSADDRIQAGMVETMWQKMLANLATNLADD